MPIISPNKEQEFILARACFIRAEGDSRIASKLAAKHEIRITPKRIEMLADRFDWYTLLDNVRGIVAENFATEAAERRERNQLCLSKAKLKLMQSILGDIETDGEGHITRVVKRAVEARSLEGCIRALVDVFGEERKLFGEKEPTDLAKRNGSMNFIQFIMNEAEKRRGGLSPKDEVRVETKLESKDENDVEGN